ncbi:hypothetical protein PMI01_03223 [Caulobacter sp. AP07]|uniref:hypothetical protein n=1 Tax=Caulobacter sp. AP07 TaxID=1144304 RepID=UPI0002720715|nr:hypothetical protein [Caulobacter sp. AP07]EJL30106.1 hypothetical protein PMI01_03223 [Caulobacter sp. AP07]
MLVPSPDQGLTVQRARLRGGGANARRVLEAALAPIDPSRIGLPRRAMLIVRRLAAAAPLGRPGFTLAVETALRNSLARAVRPARDSVAGQADSMLFDDEVELAGWLIGGRVRNDPPAARWWWPAALRGRPPAAWWRTEVLPRGDLLPRVIVWLAERGLAEPWLAELDDAELDLALGAIVHAHALDPACVEARPGVRPRRAPAKRAVNVQALTVLLRRTPELVASRLSGPARRLLAVALTVRRDAPQARDPGFAAALEALDALVPGSDPQLIARSPAPDQAADVPSKRKPSTSRSASRRATIGPAPAEPSEPGLESEPGELDAPSLDGKDTATVAPEARPAPAPGSPHDPTPSRSPAPVLPPGPALAAVLDAEDVHETETTGGVRRVTVRFGGLFYLLNALLGLELYSDFSQPRGRNLALSPWDLLAMLGARWFGPAFAADPMSGFLADLAGRTPRRRAGAGFVAPKTWITPGAWLRPWGQPATVIGWAGRRRLMLWHPAGFAIADAPRRPGRNGRDQLARLARRAGLAATTIVTAARAPVRLGHGRDRWLGLLTLYLSARLSRALGVDARDAPDLVCRHPAVVEISDGVLDIHLALADLPLALRTAGLDRDPGWIPAVGLKPAFHFT